MVLIDLDALTGQVLRDMLCSHEASEELGTDDVNFPDALLLEQLQELPTSLEGSMVAAGCYWRVIVDRGHLGRELVIPSLRVPQKNQHIIRPSIAILIVKALFLLRTTYDVKSQGI